MSEDRLQALASGRLMGTVSYQPRQDRLRFSYAPAWREAQKSYPLSISMPLGAGEFRP